MGGESRELKLGERLTFFHGDSTYHGGPGEGFGRRTFHTCGQEFAGHWKDDEQEGEGSLKCQPGYGYDSGTSYDGNWSNGAMDGQGTYTWASGSSYTGQWKEGKEHGEGTLTLFSGNSYAGQWKMGHRHGWGLYKVAAPAPHSIKAYDGEWVEGARTGRGISKGADEAVELGTYANGGKVGPAVRLELEPAPVPRGLKKGQEPPPPTLRLYRMLDGKEVEELEAPAALALAKELGFKELPEMPWNP